MLFSTNIQSEIPVRRPSCLIKLKEVAFVVSAHTVVACCFALPTIAGDNELSR